MRPLVPFLALILTASAAQSQTARLAVNHSNIEAQAGDIIPFEFTITNGSTPSNLIELRVRMESLPFNPPVLWLHTFSGKNDICRANSEGFHCYLFDFAPGEKRRVRSDALPESFLNDKLIAEVVWGPRANQVIIPIRVTVAGEKTVDLQAPRAIFRDTTCAPMKVRSAVFLGSRAYLVGKATKPVRFEGCQSFGTQILCDIPQAGEFSLIPIMSPDQKFESRIEWRVAAPGSSIVTRGATTTTVLAEKEYEYVLFPARSVRSAAADFRVQKHFSFDRTRKPRMRPPLGECAITCPFPRAFWPEEFSVATRTDPAVPGTMIEVHHEDLARMSFQFRAFALHSTRIAETTIPVVREIDYRQERLALSVNPEEGTRVTLRVFDPDARAGKQILIRYFDHQYVAHDFIAEMTVVEAHPETKVPAFFQHGFGDVRPRFIEVITFDSNQRFWAYVTKTDNTNNHITVISPD